MRRSETRLSTNSTTSVPPSKEGLASSGLLFICVDNAIKHVPGHRRTTCRHLHLQVDFSCRNSDLISSTGRSERWANIRLKSSAPGSEAREGFISSVCLSTIKIIGAQLGGNATNVHQHIPEPVQHLWTMVHCAGLAWSQDENAPLRPKSVLSSSVYKDKLFQSTSKTQRARN